MGGSERVKRVRRRNGWMAEGIKSRGGYQERTSQVAVRWRIIIVASNREPNIFDASLLSIRYTARVCRSRVRVKKLPIGISKMPTCVPIDFYTQFAQPHFISFFLLLLFRTFSPWTSERSLDTKNRSRI